MTELLRGMWQYILTFNISIFDVLDVAIIAYIVYRVLMLVQRSRPPRWRKPFYCCWWHWVSPTCCSSE